MNENNQLPGTNGYSYRAVMDVRSKNRGFAVASMILGIISIVCCCSYYIGLTAAVLSIVFAVVSRVRMGYFDGFAIAGLITGIIGVVFGITLLVIELIFVEAIEEYIRIYYPELYADMIEEA